MKLRDPGMAFLVALTASVAASLRADVPGPGDASAATRDLVRQLNADSFTARDQATRELRQLGLSARPALVEAVGRRQPLETRLRAAELLYPLSWAQPGDSTAVRMALYEYATPDITKRSLAVRKLGKIGEPAFDVLLRLLNEEPCDDVRWMIVQQLRMCINPEQVNRLMHLPQEPDDAPMIALAGWLALRTDPDRGLALLRQSADLCVRTPLEVLEIKNEATGETVEVRELMLVLTMIQQMDLNRGEYDDAIVRARQRVMHEDKPLTEAMLEVMALHADFGPLPGFEADLQLAAPGFYSPEMMYIMGRLCERRHQPLVASGWYQAARMAGLGSHDTHRRVAAFLLTRHWYDLAEVECRTALATPGPDKPSGDVHAWTLLGRIAAARGDNAKAAECLTTALTTLHGAGMVFIDTTAEARFRDEITWHQLRDARERGDRETMGDLVDHFRTGRASKLRPSDDSEMSIDEVLALKMLGRQADAAEIFEGHMAQFMHELQIEPKNPGTLNNAAWFCVRCGEQLDQARLWAGEAINYAPKNAAYLDTAAEIAFRAGQYDEAIRLETQALQVQPGDWFMTSQLVKFQKRGETR